MLSLPEVSDLGGVIVVDRVHATVLQPVCHGHPSSLHLHGVYSGVPAELQHHLTRHHLSACERCISWTIQLQFERPYGAQHCSYENQCIETLL